jgi:hypothetical protein
MDWRDRSGVAIPFLILVGVLVVVVVIGGVSYVKYKDAKSIVPVPPASCHCPDIADIRNRIAEAGAAIDAYTRLINAIAASDAAAGTPTMFSENQLAQGEATVQTAVNAAHVPGTTSGSGTTDSACVTTVKSGSACIRASLQTHENVHAASCEASKSSGRTGRFGDYKASMTMADYWREEVTAYAAEQTYLASSLAQAMAEAGCVAGVAVKDEAYPGRTNKEEMRERLAGAWRRVSAYVSGIK